MTKICRSLKGDWVVKNPDDRLVNELVHRGFIFNPYEGGWIAPTEGDAWLISEQYEIPMVILGGFVSLGGDVLFVR